MIRVFLFITLGLHRLDARAGLRPDVSDTLLRLLAGRRGAQEHLFHVVAIGGTLPAPLFLFLAGISFALVVDKLRQKDLAASQIARTTIRRGAEIFGLGLLFRAQEYLIAWGWAPWSDLFRVDILNTIGISMMLMGAICGVVLWAAGKSRQPRLVLAGTAAATALTIALLTPLLWTTWL